MATSDAVGGVGSEGGGGGLAGGEEGGSALMVDWIVGRRGWASKLTGSLGTEGLAEVWVGTSRPIVMGSYRMYQHQLNM
jgi:hypothetical protein